MAIDLPEGFQLDQPQNNGLPEGFQLDQPQLRQPQMGRGEAAFITATNPLNFGDEIKASISALTAKIMGGAATKDIDIGDLYHEARTNERAKLEQAKKTYPVQSGLIGFASDIPLEAGIIGKMGLGGASIPKLATAGGTLGAIGGAGESEADTMGGVAKDALTSGAIGAVAAPIIAAAAPKVVDIIGKGASGIKNIFSKSSGQKVADQAIPLDVAKRSLAELKNVPEGKPTTALDIQEPQTQTFLRSVVNKYPQAKQIAKDFVEGRNQQAYTRINEDLKTLSKTDNADDYINHLSEIQKKVASPLYDEAEADRTIVPKFEFKEIKTITSPQTTTISEGVKSFKTDSSTKSKTDFINKYSLQGKSRAIERPLVSQEEKELFSQGKGSLDTTKEELFNIHDRYKTALKDLKEYAPKNPLQFIKEQGGIIDSGGELKNLGINNKTIPGLLRKDGKGISIDDVGNKLYENGYFQERPSVNQVLDFIDKEVRNTNIGNRATNFSKDSTKYAEAKQFLDEADSLGIDVDAISKLKRITPQTQKTGVSGIKAGSSYDKRDVSKKGIEEFQNSLRKQTTKIEEGGKVVNIRKDITNLHEMSPKSRELAKQYDELENNKIYSEFKPLARKRLDDKIPDNSVAMLHKVRERIDADTNSLYDEFGKVKDKGRIAENTAVRNKINNLINEISPVFKQADEAFRPLAIKKEAVEFGKEFTKYKPIQINQKINELTSKSGLNKNEILEDVRVGVKDIILKEAEKAIKFEGSNIPTEIQIKQIIEDKFKRDQLKTFFPSSEDYSKFINNLNQEVLYNKTIKNLNLTKDRIKQDSGNLVKNIFASLLSVVLTKVGKSRLTVDTAKAGEAVLVKHYKGLNDKTAQELSRIFIDKNASIKMLENIINKASPKEKPIIQQAISDIYPAILAGHIGSNTTEKQSK
jgi:hypothetical protein